MEHLTALAYYGGKSPYGYNKLCQWIINLLPPPKKHQTYCEPFAGMLGILLNRPKVSAEIANDSSNHITNLWTCLRDQPDELKRRLSLTLLSEHDFQRANRELDQSTGIEQAVNTAILISMSMNHTPYCLDSHFRVKYKPHGMRSEFEVFAELIPAIHKRIKDVRFLNRDALVILDRVKGLEDAVLYCDPPYIGAWTTPYGNNTLDFDAFKELLMVQKGKVAVSSYGDFYDDLGWHRHTKAGSVLAAHKNKNPERIEVLWTNYDPSIENRDLFSMMPE